MCRIAGIINKSLSADAINGLVKNMCSVQQHGGPDDEGFYINQEENFVLGHRRLSIIDLSRGGHQPMQYGEGRYVISYNGELYNYTELRDDLKKLGCIFKTESDTEVILAAYSVWGTAAFAKFYGMFAFALWDNNEKSLLLVRDAAGIKPLYYAHTNEGIAFSSEVRALKLLPYLQEKNPEWPVYLMAYGHLPEPITTLKKVKPLKKGTYLKFTPATNNIEKVVFFQYSFLEKIQDRDEAIDLIRLKFSSAVKRHLISDAPIGVFLSGGLDSAIIAKLANRYVDTLNTLSLYFTDNQYSEKKYQDILKQELSCSHHQHLLTEDEFHTFLPTVIKSMDLPCCDGLNTWFISKYAKEAGLKTVLSGIGGDELFGGYPSFSRIKKALLLQHLPNSVLKAGRFAGSKRLRRLSYLSIPGAAGRYLFLRGQFIPGDIAKHLDADENEIWKILESEPVFGNINHLTPENQVSWMETNIYMQNQLLRDADVMSMAHGVEIRVPFLDHDFIQLAFKITTPVKYNGDPGKQLLIESFKDILPERLWNRPKMGFSFPFKEWFSNKRYAGEINEHNLQVSHARMASGMMHWSQFFTLILMQNYLDV